MTPADRNKDIEKDINSAVRVLRDGGVILYPTDTVWGIGCDATDEKAVRRIYALKRRDDHKALITLVDSEEMLGRTVSDIPAAAYDMMHETESPLTIVYDQGTGVADVLKGDDGTLGVRLTREYISSEICRRLGHPLVSTSANISGEPAARCFREISRDVLDNVDYICTSRRDERADEMPRPSSVVRICADNSFKILRK